MALKTILSWSSGKDSAWALHTLKQDPDYDVVGLLTTVNAAADRVAMHGVRREILEAQARAVGLALTVVELPWPCSNEAYEALMRGFVEDAVAAGIEAVAFGDLFLEDVRGYRERQLAGTGLTPIFPIWGLPTDKLAREMIAAGIVAHVSVVDTRLISSDFSGRRFDLTLLEELPANADPCGEKGEFHTCVSAGPMFARPLNISIGERVQREDFVYSDFIIG